MNRTELIEKARRLTDDPCTRIRDELKVGDRVNIGSDSKPDLATVVELGADQDCDPVIKVLFDEPRGAVGPLPVYLSDVRKVPKYEQCACVNEYSAPMWWTGWLCEEHDRTAPEDYVVYVESVESAIRAGLQALHAQPEHGFAVGDRVQLISKPHKKGVVHFAGEYSNGMPRIRVRWDGCSNALTYGPSKLRKLPPQPEREATVEEPTQPEDKAEHCAGCKAPLRPDQVGFACIGSPIVLCFYCYARTERQDLPAGSYEAESGPGLRAVPVVDPDPITGLCFATAGWEEP